jgi:hypothetical protein
MSREWPIAQGGHPAVSELVEAWEGVTDVDALTQASIVLSPEARFSDAARIPIGKAALLSEN